MCEQRKAKQNKQAAKMRDKKVHKSHITKLIIEHPRPVAPLDLLLSIAENRSRESAVKNEINQASLNKSNHKGQPNNGTSEGTAKRALVKNGYIYLSISRKAEDCSVKMKLQQKNLFESLYSDFSLNTSKYNPLLNTIRLASAIFKSNGMHSDVNDVHIAKQLMKKLKDIVKIEQVRRPAIFSQHS